MKIGRNDPCPCGSGKKYKQCCLAAANQELQTPDHLARRRLRAANQDLPARMMRFLEDAYGNAVGADAWGEFVQWDDDLMDETTLAQVASPWILHCWSPTQGETEIDDPSLYGVKPTRAFLNRYGARLDPLAVRYLEACLATPFSFFEILDSRPGTEFTARDLFTRATHRVLEQSASKSLRSGDLLYGQVVEWDGFSLLEAACPRVFQPQDKLRVLELREELSDHEGPWTREQLFAAAEEVRAKYLEIHAEKISPVLPTLTNTDGELVVQQELVFDIESPQGTFAALAHLESGAEIEELEGAAQYDQQGNLVSISFPWTRPGNQMHKDWDNTILGNITINGARMTVTVNSNERAQTFRDIVARTLGDAARYRMASVQSGDALMAGASKAVRQKSPDPINPEAQKMLDAVAQDMLRKHYETWVDQPLPILGGATPREAAQQAAGREKVEALVQQLERSGNPGLRIDPEIPRLIRQRLGLECG